MRAGVIRNPRSHAYRRGRAPADPADALIATPSSPEELLAELERFWREGVDLLVIDGGDGTVREVLSALPSAYAIPPLLAVLPSGKTNILALDLALPKGWTAAEAARAAARGRMAVRAPLAVRSTSGSMQGFVFGAAGFVGAISRSQGLHAAGVFHEGVVALGVVAAVGSLMVGGRGSTLGEGEHLTLRIDEGESQPGLRLATVATTLERLPFGMRPFGPPRPGLKLLDVDAPPRGLAAALGRLVRGDGDAWLAARGYRRRTVRRIDLTLTGPYVLDGEIYPAGEVTLTEGPQLRFVLP